MERRTFHGHSTTGRPMGASPVGKHCVCNRHFEYNRPDQAIAILSQIPRAFFSRFHQEWRDIKRREIILSCRMMRNETIDDQEIKDIIRIHQTDPAEEVWPLPEELVSTTVKVLTDARIPSEHRSLQVSSSRSSSELGSRLLRTVHTDRPSSHHRCGKRAS